MITTYCVKIIEECHGLILQNEVRRKGNILKSVFVDKAIRYTWEPGMVISCFRKNLKENITFLEENELKEGYEENKTIIIGFLKSILDDVHSPTQTSVVTNLYENTIISDAIYWSQPQPGFTVCAQKKYIEKFNEYLQRTQSLVL